MNKLQTADKLKSTQNMQRMGRDLTDYTHPTEILKQLQRSSKGPKKNLSPKEIESLAKQLVDTRGMGSDAMGMKYICDT